MNISELKKIISKKKLPANCLLFCPSVSGSKESFEPVLVEEAIEQLIKNFIPEGTESMSVSTFYGDETNLNEIVMDCRTLPFFSPKKVVIVRKFEALDRSEKSESKAMQNMLEYLQNPVDATLLICVEESVDTRKPMYKAFSKINGLVECPALTISELREWIKQYLKEKNKKISPGALEEFVARCGTRLSDVQNSLALLLGYVGDKGTITIEDVITACADVAEESIWSLTDAIARGDMKGAWLVLNDLFNQGKEPPEIISVIHWLLENAYRTTDLAEVEPKSSFVMKKVAPLAKRFGLKRLVSAMSLCNEVTFAMRQTGMDERLALELLVVKLSYVPTRTQRFS